MIKDKMPLKNLSDGVKACPLEKFSFDTNEAADMIGGLIVDKCVVGGGGCVFYDPNAESRFL